MTYQTLCTFDLKNATASDYQTAYNDLHKLGLSPVQAGTKGNYVIPTTTVMGDFNGSSATSVRDDIRDRVRNAFQSRGFKSEIFVAVGENGTWGAATT